jgi:hypothetical protein
LQALITQAGKYANAYTDSQMAIASTNLTNAINALHTQVTAETQASQQATIGDVEAYSDAKAQEITTDFYGLIQKLNGKINALYQMIQPSVSSAQTVSDQKTIYDGLETDTQAILTRIDGLDAVVDGQINVGAWNLPIVKK